MTTRTIETEILVIGSGFGAAAPALRLSRVGLRVLIVEKGPDIVPTRDFHQTQDPEYLLRYLKGLSGDSVGFTYAEGLGGGSGFYEMVSLRAPSKTFEQVDAAGRRLWPEGVHRKSLDPFYDEAERMLNVEQVPEDRLPRTGVAFSHLMKNLGYSCDRARYAVKGCLGSGYCVSGCIFGAKQSLHFNYLPEARKAGAEILTDLEAREIRTLGDDLGRTRDRAIDARLPYRYETACAGQEGAGDVVIRSKAVVLGGGTVGTARLLLDSRRGLARLGSHVGRNIAVNGSVKAAGILPDGFVEGDMVSGMSHPGVISYQFWEERGITISAAKPLPLTLLASARLSLRGDPREPRSWGRAHVELMKHYRRRMIVLYALGLTPPMAVLEHTGPGKVRPSMEITPDLVRFRHETHDLLESILDRNGVRLLDTELIDLEGRTLGGPRFDTAHMTGSARMADRPEDGVVDVFGEAFEYPGLFVTDGAAVPSSLGVNSSLTILANAERIAAHMAERLRP
jgi:choline dehydrogenase-like flavoprotein